VPKKVFFTTLLLLKTAYISLERIRVLHKLILSEVLSVLGEKPRFSEGCGAIP
jgi:hypothetical protein